MATVGSIILWDDLDYMIEEMKIKPYDWDILGDFPLPEYKYVEEKWVVKVDIEDLYSNFLDSASRAKFLCPNGHECFEARKEFMKGYIYCYSCYSNDLRGMYYPIHSDKVVKL